MQWQEDLENSRKKPDVNTDATKYNDKGVMCIFVVAAACLLSLQCYSLLNYVGGAGPTSVAAEEGRCGGGARFTGGSHQLGSQCWG